MLKFINLTRRTEIGANSYYIEIGGHRTAPLLELTGLFGHMWRCVLSSANRRNHPLEDVQHVEQQRSTIPGNSIDGRLVFAGAKPLEEGSQSE